MAALPNETTDRGLGRSATNTPTAAIKSGMAALASSKPDI
jgi:hypothetical protein